MAKFGKWIGGSLGFTLGGPLGALAGFFLGSIIDEAENIIQPSVVPTTGKVQIGT
jgi:DnaJ like chaperone protein